MHRNTNEPKRPESDWKRYVTFGDDSEKQGDFNDAILNYKKAQIILLNQFSGNRSQVGHALHTQEITKKLESVKVKYQKSIETNVKLGMMCVAFFGKQIFTNGIPSELIQSIAHKQREIYLNEERDREKMSSEYSAERKACNQQRQAYNIKRFGRMV
jgi:hypothetical protein